MSKKLEIESLVAENKAVVMENDWTWTSIYSTVIFFFLQKLDNGTFDASNHFVFYTAILHVTA